MLAHDRGLQQVKKLHEGLASCVAGFGAGITGLASMVACLFLALLLLGLALLLGPAASGRLAQSVGRTTDTGDVETYIVHPESLDGGSPGADTLELPEIETTDPEARALATDMGRLAQAIQDLTGYLDADPVAEAAFDCLAVLREAGRCLANEKLLASASALEQVLKSGGERWEVTEAAADLATVCDALAAPDQG